MDMLTRIGLLFFGLAAGLTPHGPSPEVAGVEKMMGKPAVFSLKTIDGKTLTQRTEKGKVVLIDFWATWCTVCKQATPVMQALHTKHSKSGLVVVAANALEEDGKKGPQASKEYKAKGAYTFPFAYNADALLDRWGGAGLPTIVLIDRKGVVRFTADYWDAKIKSSLEAMVAKLVAEKP